MNFKKNSIALASLLCLTALTGCGKNKGQATLDSMKITGIVTAYMEDETIDWSSLTVTANYSDKSTTTFANSEIEFDVETPAEGTKLVVYTSGLHAQTAPYTEGEYDVKAALKADLSKKYDLGSISVGTITPAKYKLRTFEVPEFVNKYQETVKNAGAASEGEFRKAEELFTVGTLNTFKFAPVASFSKNGVVGKFYVSDNYAKTVSLKVVNGNEKTEASADSYEVVKGGINFKEAAAGHTYELTMSPAGFQINGVTPEVKFTFKVERGLNVYSAKELGALNLTHYTENDFEVEGTTFEEHVGALGRGNSASKVFFKEDTSEYYRPNYKQLWKSFLGTSGTFTDAELTAYEDVPAIFFQDDIVLKTTDIPAEFFITAKEAQTAGAPSRAGSLRDDSSMYVPIVHDQDVVINGNYFRFDATNIPLCNSTTAAPVDLYIFGENYEGQVPPGHATVFKFCGIDPINSEAYYKSQVDTANGHKGVVKNVNAVGNTSLVNVDQNDKIMEVTGLIFAKNTQCGASYYNNLIKQFQIGLFPDCNVGQPYGKEQVNRTFIEECKVFDCSNCGICNYHNGGALVTHSEFDRFGGAPLLNAGCKDAWNYGIITTGEDVKLRNEITGGEVYYTAVGAASQFTPIKGWDQLFTLMGNKFVKDNKMNLIALNMDGEDYVASPNKEYYADVYLNKGLDNEVHGGILSTDMNWAVYSSTGKQAPTFCTEKANEIFYFNGNGFVNPILETAFDPSTNTYTMTRLEGRILNILLPVGNTTLNAVFQLYA